MGDNGVIYYHLVDLGWPSLQQLGAGFGFPARDWAGWRRRKQQILATRPVVSDKGPGPLALQKRISTKTESSEASKVFIRRKKCTWADSENP